MNMHLFMLVIYVRRIKTHNCLRHVSLKKEEKKKILII